ncbi:hypothetical protein ACTFIY_008470 [Dictyostelium cf. discoideum]
MDIGDESFNCYTLNDRGGKLLVVSKMKGTLHKILFIQEFLQDKCANDTIDGIIIKKKLSIQQYNKFESKYNNLKFEYQNNGGFVVIYKNLSTGIGHVICAQSLNKMFLSVNNLYITEVLGSTLDLTIALPQGYNRQPDCSFLPIEVGISQSTRHLVDKCYTYFAKPHIEIVIGIKVFPKEVDGTFKAIAFYFSRLGMVYNCQSIISFGSRRTSELDENLFLQLVNSQNQNLLAGVLSSNELIPSATLLDGAVPPPQLLPNTENAIPIDMQFTSCNSNNSSLNVGLGSSRNNNKRPNEDSNVFKPIKTQTQTPLSPQLSFDDDDDINDRYEEEDYNEFDYINDSSDSYIVEESYSSDNDEPDNGLDWNTNQTNTFLK